MGLFLSASGIIGSDVDAVGQSIVRFAAEHKGVFRLLEGASQDDRLGLLAESGGNVTVLFPQDFMAWDELSQHLSADLDLPVFSFHIHDGDLWMFQLLRAGEIVSGFNPIPDYWGEIDDAERASWSGDASAIAAVLPGVTKEAISNYLVQWDDSVYESEAKAYPDDEFLIGEDWQLVDFMRKVGLPWPENKGGELSGTPFELKVRRR